MKGITAHDEHITAQVLAGQGGWCVLEDLRMDVKKTEASLDLEEVAKSRM